MTPPFFPSHQLENNAFQAITKTVGDRICETTLDNIVLPPLDTGTLWDHFEPTDAPIVSIVIAGLSP